MLHDCCGVIGRRQPELECLLGMDDAELQDAWVLLEPRLEENGKGGEAGGRLKTQLQKGTISSAAGGKSAAAQPAAKGGAAEGGWRTKRGGKAASTAAAPAPKRQQTAAPG